MTLDQLQQRDARIAVLERAGDDRTADQDDEFLALTYARDMHWRRFDKQLHSAIRKANELKAYAQQIGFSFVDAKVGTA